MNCSTPRSMSEAAERCNQLEALAGNVWFVLQQTSLMDVKRTGPTVKIDYGFGGVGDALSPSMDEFSRFPQLVLLFVPLNTPYLLTQRTTDKYTHRLSTIWRQGQTICSTTIPHARIRRLVWWCAGIFLLPSICHIFSFWFPLLWLRYILLIAFDAFIEFQIDLSQRGSVATVVQLWLPKSIFRTLQTSFFDQSGRQ